MIWIFLSRMPTIPPTTTRCVSRTYASSTASWNVCLQFHPDSSPDSQVNRGKHVLTLVLAIGIKTGRITIMTLLWATTKGSRTEHLIQPMAPRIVTIRATASDYATPSILRTHKPPVFTKIGKMRTLLTSRIGMTGTLTMIMTPAMMETLRMV